jgi:MoxR-like ATPase
MVWKINNCNNLVTAPEFNCAAGHHMDNKAKRDGALEMMRQIESTRGMLSEIEDELADEIAVAENDTSKDEYSVLVPEQILLTLCMELDIPFVLTSPAGRGKTATIQSIAEGLEMNIIEIQASSADAMDIAGRPTNQIADLDTGKDFGGSLQTLVSVAPDWMRRWSSDEPNMLFFDEVDKAPVDVQNAMLKLFDERILNTGDKLPKGTLIAAAGNFTADSGAEDFTTALISRMVPISWIDPSLSEAEGSLRDLEKVRKEGRDSNFRKKFPPLPFVDRDEFKRFLGVAKNAREQYISTLRGDIDLDSPTRDTIRESYDSSNLNNFATDRTWLMAERLLAYHDAVTKADPSSPYASHKDAVRDRIINGTLGRKRGQPYLTLYRNQVSIPTFEDLVNDTSVYKALSPEVKTVVRNQLEKNLVDMLNGKSSPIDKVQTIKNYISVAKGITSDDPNSIESLNFGSEVRSALTRMELQADAQDQEIFVEAKRRFFAIASKR